MFSIYIYNIISQKNNSTSSILVIHNRYLTRLYQLLQFRKAINNISGLFVHRVITKNGWTASWKNIKKSMSKFIAQTEEKCINCNEDIPAGATIYVNEFDGAVLCEMCKNGEKDLNYY